MEKEKRPKTGAIDRGGSPAAPLGKGGPTRRHRPGGPLSRLSGCGVHHRGEPGDRRRNDGEDDLCVILAPKGPADLDATKRFTPHPLGQSPAWPAAALFFFALQTSSRDRDNTSFTAVGPSGCITPSGENMARGMLKGLHTHRRGGADQSGGASPASDPFQGMGRRATHHKKKGPPVPIRIAALDYPPGKGVYP